MKKVRFYKKWINRFLKAVESSENRYEPCTYTYFKKYRPIKGKYAKFLWDRLQPESPFYDSPKFNQNRKYYFVDTLQGFIPKRESGIRVKTPTQKNSRAKSWRLNKWICRYEGGVFM